MGRGVGGAKGSACPQGGVGLLRWVNDIPRSCIPICREGSGGVRGVITFRRRSVQGDGSNRISVFKALEAGASQSLRGGSD